MKTFKQFLLGIIVALAILVGVPSSQASALNNCHTYIVESNSTSVTMNNVHTQWYYYNCHVRIYMRNYYLEGISPRNRCYYNYSGFYVYFTGAYGPGYYCTYAGE